jgi:hypothetical protein
MVSLSVLGSEWQRTSSTSENASDFGLGLRV